MPKQKHIRGNHLTASSKKSHAANRLTERYSGMDFSKLSNFILKSRQFDVLDSDDLGIICRTHFDHKDIYFVLHTRYRGEEIATFLTPEMAEKALEDKFMRRIDWEEV